MWVSSRAAPATCSPASSSPPAGGDPGAAAQRPRHRAAAAAGLGMARRLQPRAQRPTEPGQRPRTRVHHPQRADHGAAHHPRRGPCGRHRAADRQSALIRRIMDRLASAAAQLPARSAWSPGRISDVSTCQRLDRGRYRRCPDTRQAVLSRGIRRPRDEPLADFSEPVPLGLCLRPRRVDIPDRLSARRYSKPRPELLPAGLF